jgi:hypothetical protein
MPYCSGGRTAAYRYIEEDSNSGSITLGVLKLMELGMLSRLRVLIVLFSMDRYGRLPVYVTCDHALSCLFFGVRFAPAFDTFHISLFPAVILYTQEAFRDVTRAPSWAGAVNDGRIRVPVQGVETVSPELERVLKHELTHSFVFQKTTGRCPTWLNEGIAQWMEGRRSGTDAGPLVASFERENGKALRYLPGSWTKLTDLQARFAYAWSLAVVEAVEAQSGLNAIDRLLDAERTKASGEAALREALRTGFSGLDDTTIAYLRQTYLH